jgi:predicted CXXCH cytochrome family protein
MKSNITLKVLTGLAILSCSVLFMACANQGQKETTADTPEPALVVEAAETDAVAATTPAKAEQQASSAPLYTQAPRSLSPVECAACHNGQYVRLQQSNSKHRFDCLDCHDQLHANIPSKNNYNDILPKCANCHELFHGEAFPKCSQCHRDPHSPLDIPFDGVKENVKNQAGKSVVACEVCHYDSEGKEMETYPNKHNVNVGCTGCHGDEKHGVRPTCFDCHEPHTAGQTYADCLVCHKPHSAKNILPYPEEMSNTVCAACHTKIYDNLQANHTKHTDLQCASCHVTHGQIPRCQECHDEPHGSAVHKRFPNCLECHVDPHDLPVNPQA